MFRLNTISRRPDFRVLIDLLFDPGRNVDTSGNCRFPEDQSWTDVFIRDRESNQPHVVAYVPDEYWDDDDNCLRELFHIKSEHQDSEEVVALFLYEFCGDTIWDDSGRLSELEIETLRKKHSEKLARAKNSRFFTHPTDAG